MIAFAGNSLLCRAALKHTAIDPATFTSVRMLSGALTSGVGYAIWYAALRGLKAASAATVQLSVPVIAAIGGVIMLGEPITLRLLGTSIAVLGGIALVVLRPKSRG